jgi:hypothetical protein
MNGPEHYRAAEAIIHGEFVENDIHAPLISDRLALAQVHATLALAAAVVEVAGSAPFLDGSPDWWPTLRGTS